MLSIFPRVCRLGKWLNNQLCKECCEPCYPCESFDAEVFQPCGHANQVSCPTNNWPKVCRFELQLDLPCGHIKTIACGAPQKSLLQTEVCDEICEHVLNCGHFCGLACHGQGKQQHNDKCLEPCENPSKNCSLGHPCRKLCHQNCDECSEIIQEFDLECGHKVKDVKCGQLKSYACMQRCAKYLSCGLHQCKNFCYEDCEPSCSVLARKTLDCGHLVQSACCQYSAGGNDKCLEPCSRLLACGHTCPLLCHQPCGDAVCQVILPANDKLATSCGHQAFRKCGNFTAIEPCVVSCSSRMECGHICSFQCGQCLNGKLHLPCQDKCQRVLVCGHVCQLKCGQACQPCSSKQKCLFQCQHRKCKSNCDDDCSDCKVSLDHYDTHTFWILSRIFS